MDTRSRRNSPSCDSTSVFFPRLWLIMMARAITPAAKIITMANNAAFMGPCDRKSGRPFQFVRETVPLLYLRTGRRAEVTTTPSEKKAADFLRGPVCDFECETAELDEAELPAHFQGELERARIERRGRLAGVASCRISRVAQRTDIAHVETVEQVEHVHDGIEPHAFTKRKAPRDAHIPLKETRTYERVAAEIAVASCRRSYASHGERRTRVGQARRGQAERHTGNVRRADTGSDRRTALRSTEIQPKIRAGQNSVGTPGS